MNFIFTAITLFFTVIFGLKAVDPRGQGWASKIIEKFKLKKKLEANDPRYDQIRKDYIDKYEPQLQQLKENITESIARREQAESGPCGIRGPKIIYTKPSDKETVLPALNDPIKRFSLDDFLPISAVEKQRKAEASLSPPKPITLDNLKSIYLSRKY